MPQEPTTPSRTTLTVVFVIIAAFCMLVANSAFWFSKNIFNTENFSKTATAALTSQSSRDSLAAGITAKILEGRPVLQQVVGDSVQKTISGLLNSNQAQTIFSGAITRLHTVVTSPNPQPVAIDLSGIKSTLGTISNLVGQATTTEPQINVAQIPDQIVLLDTSKLPNIYHLGSVLLWLGPLALVVAIILLALPIYWARKDRHLLQEVLFGEGVAIILISFFGFLVGPLFKPQFVYGSQDPNARAVIENVYNAFVQTFNNQTWWMFVVGLVFLGVAAFFHYRPQQKRT